VVGLVLEVEGLAMLLRGAVVEGGSFDALELVGSGLKAFSIR
jgi:hypothetical protein